MFTGGLVGFAIVLSVLGHSMWVAHVVAAAVSVIAVIIGSIAMRRRHRAIVWHLIPVVATVALFFVAWF